MFGRLKDPSGPETRWAGANRAGYEDPRATIFVDSYYRALTPAEVSMIEEHLGRCEYCRERYHFEAQLRDTVKTVCCGDPVPADLVDRVRLAIRDQSA